VTHVFGVNPDAYHKSVVIAPHLPSGWNQAAIFELPVGNNRISFRVQRHDNKATYSLTSVAADWNYTLKIKGLTGGRYKLNGRVITATSDEIQLKGRINKIDVL
jgi:hypothetical protein